MPNQELVGRARQYLLQALERLTSLEQQGAPGSYDTGTWVSMKANLNSAAADLETVLKEA